MFLWGYKVKDFDLQGIIFRYCLRLKEKLSVKKT